MDLNKKTLPRGIFLLSFLLPFFITTLCFAFDRIAPFGPNGLLKADAWAQYHPYLSLYRDTLLRGGSLEHTWNIGMGINFLPIFAYYLSSPLYLLSVLVPEAYLLHFMLFVTVVKISFAGLFFTVFVSKAYGIRCKILPFFGLMYSLCAWSTGYYWNIIWLDVFALLPLLIAGTLSMLREGRFRLYVLSLALCFWCNYYLSFCCCIFVLLCFIGYEICCWKGRKNLLRSFIRFGLCTILSFSLAAVLLIPTLLGMQNTVSVQNGSFPLFSLSLPDIIYSFSLSALLEAFAQILGRTMATDPTFMEGLPNVFCGFPTIILAFSFLLNKAFSRKDRLFHGSLLVFLILSFILRALDFFWHGFHFPNMIPARFSFLFSFVVLAMAFRGYTELHRLNWKRILISVGFGFFIFLLCIVYRTELSFGYYSIPLALCVLVATSVFFLLRGKVSFPKLSHLRRMKLSAILLAILFLEESFICASAGVDKGLSHEESMSYSLTGQELYQSVEEADSELFYRTEFAHEGTSNDGAIHHYNAVDVFSSSALVNFGNFASALGLRAWPDSNSVTYEESMPLTHTLCGIKYLLGEEGSILSSQSLPLVDRLDGYELRSVPSYIGIGFMTNSELATFASLDSVKNPFEEQTQIFHLATGLDGELYRYVYHPELDASEGCSLEYTDNNTQFLYKVAEDQERGTFTLRYTMEEAGFLSFATRMSGGKRVKVYLNHDLVIDAHPQARGIFTLGHVLPGDVIEFTYTSNIYKEAGISLFLTFQNDELLQQGLDILSDEVWNITYTDDTTLSGTITALEDGFFYSSVPYEPGWTVTVDGEEVPIATGYNPKNPDVLITDAMISFPLQAGTHEIIMSYHTPGLTLGFIISLGALAIFILSIICKKKTLLPDLIPTKKETPYE